MTITICGVPLTVTFGFCLLLALFAWQDWVGIGCWLLLTVTLHELGHLAVLFCLGARPKSITCSCIGVAIDRDGDRFSTWRESLVLLAGPVVNLLLFALLQPRLPMLRLPVRVFVFSNLMLGLFNLLPLPPLDGGNLLRLWLEEWLPGRWARRLVLLAGSGVLLLLAAPAAGLLLLRRNPTLLLTWCYLCFLLVRESCAPFYLS